MTYNPINVQAYTSAYSGAIAGMAVSGWIVDPTAGHYALVAAIAGAFAQEFDVVWNNAAVLNDLESKAITTVCQNEFASRGPGSLDNPTFTTPLNWLIPATACAALVLEADAYFASQGINPGTSETGPALANFVFNPPTDFPAGVVTQVDCVPLTTAPVGEGDAGAVGSWFGAPPDPALIVVGCQCDSLGTAIRVFILNYTTSDVLGIANVLVTVTYPRAV